MTVPTVTEPPRDPPPFWLNHGEHFVFADSVGQVSHVACLGQKPVSDCRDMGTVQVGVIALCSLTLFVGILTGWAWGRICGR